MILCLPTYEIIRALEGKGVLEIGAGTGLWVRILTEAGIDIIGIDPKPRGPDVICADHSMMASWPDRDLLLIVWPPDETDVAQWVGGWCGEVLVIGSLDRFSLPEWPWIWETMLPPGPKGGSHARFMRLAG